MQEIDAKQKAVKQLEDVIDYLDTVELRLLDIKNQFNRYEEDKVSLINGVELSLSNYSNWMYMINNSDYKFRFKNLLGFNWTEWGDYELKGFDLNTGFIGGDILRNSVTFDMCEAKLCNI